AGGFSAAGARAGGPVAAVVRVSRWLHAGAAAHALLFAWRDAVVPVLRGPRPHRQHLGLDGTPERGPARCDRESAQADLAAQAAGQRRRPARAEIESIWLPLALLLDPWPGHG